MSVCKEVVDPSGDLFQVFHFSMDREESTFPWFLALSMRVNRYITTSIFDHWGCPPNCHLCSRLCFSTICPILMTINISSTLPWQFSSQIGRYALGIVYSGFPDLRIITPIASLHVLGWYPLLLFLLLLVILLVSSSDMAYM